MSAASGFIGTNSPSAQHFFAEAARAQRAGQLEAAAAAYRQVLLLKPDLLPAHHNLGLVLRGLGRLDEAATAFENALAVAPSSVESRLSLGLVFQAQGRLDAAAIVFEQALAQHPNHPGARMNLGNIEHLRGNLDGAVATFRVVIAGYPDIPEAHVNLAAALKAQGDFAGATASLERALALRPDYALAHHHLAGVLAAQGRPDEAMTCYERALSLRPDLAEAHTNLANLLQGRGRLEAAEAAYRRAVALRSNDPAAHMNLARALQSQGRLPEALAAFDAVLSLDPDHNDASHARLCALNYQPDITPTALLAEHRRWAGRFDQPPPFVHANDRDPERRLRVGYVSADLHQHPVGFFLAPVLEAHGSGEVEVFVYANGDRTDAMTGRLGAAAHRWRGIVDLSDAEAAVRIAEDRIDILIDLSGHTPGERLGLFALRPAPVQASWLGYAATTGLAAMDYLVMDPWTAPPGAEAWCAEALVRLPHGRFCYGPPEDAPAPAPPPSIAKGRVTFGSFNNLAKLNPEVAALWAAVLRKVPNARLVLKWTSLADAAVQARVRAMFAAAGAPDGALELRGFSPHAEVLAQYGDIDIALDPFPFCGGLTSCEALWMGVPVVTWPGDRFAARQTAGFLHSVGLDDLVAGSADDYVAIAAALAVDGSRREALRWSLRPRLAASPLGDAALFTPGLEAAYRHMWRRWCAGQKPEAFDP